MPVFSAAGAAAATAIFGAGATSAIAIGGALGGFVGGVALNSLAGAMADPVGAAPLASIRKESARGVVSRAFQVGRTATAGSVFFENTSDLGTDDENRYYVVGHCLSDIPVRGLDEIWVNDLRCTIGGNYVAGRGYPIIPPAYYPEEMEAWITFYDGTQTTADPVLLAAAETGYEWDETDILRGCAYATCVFKGNPEVFPQFPQLLYVVDGVRLKDAGTGQMGTGDELTAVQIDNLLAGIKYGGELFYGPQVPGVLENAAEQADVCRLPVPGAANWTSQRKQAAFGSQTVPAQYRSGMEIPVSMPIADAISELMAAANAKIAFTGSGYRLLCGEPGQSVRSITSNDIILDRAQSFAPFLPLAETINSVLAVYPEPKRKWQDREVTPLIVPSYEAEDGNRRLATTLQCKTVYSGEQVQRLRKSALAEARRAARVTFTVGPEFFALQPLDVIALTDARTGSDGKLYRVDGIADETAGRMTVDLTEVDPTDYDYDEVDFDGVDPPPVVQQPVGEYDLLGFNADDVVIADQNGVPRRPGIRATWTPAQSGQQVAYRVFTADTNTIVTRGVAALKDGETITSDGIVPLGEYDVDARKLQGKGRTPWTDRVRVTVGDIRFGAEDIQANILEVIIDQTEYAQNVAEQITLLQEGASDAQDRINEIINLDAPGTKFDQLIEQLEVGVNGTSAAINEFKQVATDVEGFAGAYAGLTVTTNGGNIAGFRATSWDSPDGSGGLLELLGTVVVPGTMSVDRLVSGNGANDLKNANFAQALRYWRYSGDSTVGTQTEMSLKPANTNFATPTSPTLRLRQVGSSSSGYAQASSVEEFFDGSTTNLAVAAKAGAWYIVSARIATRDCNGDLIMVFRDSTGASVGSATKVIGIDVGAGSNPEAWPITFLKAQAPSGTVAVQVFYRKRGTLSGFESNLYVHKPQVEETHAEATQPTPWTAGGVSLIEGGTAFFEQSVTSNAVNTVSFAAAGLALFGDEIRSTNYIAGVQGWRIDNDGPADFPNGIKTGDLRINAATEAVGIEGEGSINLNVPAGAQVMVMMFAQYTLSPGSTNGATFGVDVIIGNLGTLERTDNQGAGSGTRKGTFAAATSINVPDNRPALTITVDASGGLFTANIDTVILVSKR